MPFVVAVMGGLILALIGLLAYRYVYEGKSAQEDLQALGVTASKAKEIAKNAPAAATKFVKETVPNAAKSLFKKKPGAGETEKGAQETQEKATPSAQGSGGGTPASFPPLPEA